MKSASAYGKVVSVHETEHVARERLIRLVELNPTKSYDVEYRKADRHSAFRTYAFPWAVIVYENV
jgi:hypothetical protein